MTVGGWFDAEDLFGALNTYYSIEKSSPNATNILVMGPWYHGGWSRSDGELLGNVHFDSKTAAFYRENIELPFFQHFLKNKGAMTLPEAFVFETGTNVWRQYDAWPPRKAAPKRLYLRPERQALLRPAARPAPNSTNTSAIPPSPCPSSARPPMA